jgi:DNA-damage-inducible protein J
MTQSSVIHARVDPDTKAATEKILQAIGMTPTEAIRLLYRQIAIRGEFPLELKVPNALTSEALSAADRGDDLESFESTDELYGSWQK